MAGLLNFHHTFYKNFAHNPHAKPVYICFWIHFAKNLISASIWMYLPASCRARRIFCCLFHQHTEQITISSNDNNAPKAMPTLAPTERWGPQVGSPGMPQSPALSVKLQISTVNTCSRDLVTIPLPKKYQTICFHNLEYENFLYLHVMVSIF